MGSEGTVVLVGLGLRVRDARWGLHRDRVGKDRNRRGNRR